MALISIKRDVDLQPGLTAPAVFHCSQGDVGTTIMLGLLNGGVEYPITTSTTIQISGSRSTGEVFSSVNATWSGSTVSFNLTAEMTADAGPTLCEAVLTRGSDILGTANFILAVEENPMGNVPPGIFTDAGWLWVLDKLSSEQVAALGDDVIGAIASKANESTIAPEFSASTAYTVGNYVYKDGVLYRFTSNHTGAWTGTDAETVTVGGEVKDLKADLTDNSANIGDAVFAKTELSSVQTSSGWKLTDDGYRVADENYQLMRFRVFAGDIVKVVSDHKWQFQTSTTVTASGTLYRVGNTRQTGVCYVEVPNTVTYVVISTPTTSAAHVYKCTSNIDELLSDIVALEVYASDNQDNIATLSGSVYTTGNELSSVQTSAGWKLTDDGYRVEDANYQLVRFRVYEGNYVQVTADHKFQFQTSTTVTASGTLYRVGRTMSAGTFWLKVPSGVTYVVASTPISDSATHCYNITDNISGLNSKVTEVAEGSNTKFASLFNSYTSQVSDIPYTGTVTSITIGIDTTNEKFVSGSQHALCIPIIPGTSIRVQKPQTVYCQVCFTNVYPAANVAITHRTGMNSIVNTEFVAESQSTDNYLVIYTHTTEVAVADCAFAYSRTARGTVELLPQLDWRMINLLKYRPVGKVSKAYIALSCDDGHNSLATYTIPRIQYWNSQYNTNIPLHMALFDNSPVFESDEYTALVTDMCENHNCSIGIHGTQPYEYYSSSTALYAYLKKQWDTIVDKTGITPTSVIYPHSSYNDQIMVMTAGFCGICGASGSDPSPYTYSDDHGLAFYVGEKSNCYEVYRLSIKDTRIGNANEAHRIIDYAIAHNLIICPYFHDDDFTEYSEATNEFNKAMLDAFIQYGMEQGVEFVNFGDIPKLL